MARGRKSSPAWAWLLTGMLIGLFAAFLVYLNDTRGTSGNRTRSDKPAAQQQGGSEQGGARFDFYTILPDMEIPVPDIQEILPDKGARPQGNAPAPDNKVPDISNPVAAGTYVLQAGAFRSVEEADRLKAKLALLGVIAHIESADINGTTWHRVRIGPYDNMSRLNDTNNRLKQNGINAMLLKLKG